MIYAALSLLLALNFATISLQKAVEASMEEHIKNVETELDKLREEGEKMLRELEDEMESPEMRDLGNGAWAWKLGNMGKNL
ncbi:hypothetical protein QBC45DRAFT_395674 [Copromyces sp. CBS 386.78]|nr:hypothetical protein QBC45DRAFT_395674 [Copromyces sp. CBS 386.78]